MPDFDFIEEGQTPTTTFDFQPDFQMPKPTALEQYKIEHMGGPPMGPFGPVIPPEEFIGTPNIFTIPLAAMAGAGKVAEEAIKPAEEMTAEWLQRTGINRAAQAGVPMLNLESYPITAGGPPGMFLRAVRPDVAAEIDKTVGQLMSGFTTPGQAALLPAAGLKPVQAIFGAGAMAGIPESVKEIAQAETAPQRAGAITRGAFNVGLAGAIGKSLLGPRTILPRTATEVLQGQLEREVPNASEVEATTTLHGDVRPQPERGAGEVPPEVSGAGVLPQAEGVAKEGQVSLTPEEQQHLDLGREGVANPVEVVERLYDESNAPFAGRRMATVRPDGTIEIQPGVYSQWLKGVPEEQRPAAVRAMLAEEANHDVAQKVLTPEEIEGFWNNLSGAEQAMFTRIYTGEWSIEKANARFGTNLDARLMGFEALNHFQMRFGKMTPREVAEAVRGEKWTVQTLELLTQLLYKIRANIPTIRDGRLARGTAAAGMQQALLDRVLFNVQAAKAVAKAGPGAFRKEREIPEDPSTLIGEVNLMGPDEFYQFTTQLRGMTEGSEDLGMSLTKPEQLEAMYAAREEALRQFRQAVITKDVDGMTAYSGKSQYFGEAIEAATGTGGTGDSLRKTEPDYKPPFPEAAGEFGPASFRKGKERGTPEMFLPPMLPGQVRESAFKAPTAFQFEKMASDYMAQAEAPSFGDFVEQMQRAPEFGSTVKPGMLVDIWQGAVYRRLLNAEAGVLEKLRKDLGLVKQYGERDIAEPPAERKTYELEPEATAEAKQAMRDERKIVTARQNYRRTVIRAIADKLIAPALEDTSHLGRTELTPEDLGFANKTKQPVVNEIPSRFTSDADYLERVLTEDARQNLKKVSETNRVSVVQNKDTLEAFLLSTYKDGRRGVLLKNPKGEGQLPLRNLLENYRVVSSLFLDRPVKDFSQRFESLGDYESRFGTEARRASQRSIVEAPPTEGELMGRGPTTGRYATPGVFQAEPGIAQRLAAGEAPDLTRGEAGGILDHLIDEVDKVESVGDVLDAIEGLNYAAAQKRLTAKDWTAIAGYAKVFDSIQEKWPQLTPEQVFDQMVDEIYDKASKAETSTAFENEVLADYTRQVPTTARGLPSGPVVGPRLPSAPTELMMRQRIPPTVDPNVLVPKGPGPRPEIGGERATPAAFLKQQQAANDLWLRSKGAIAAAIKRRSVMVDIPQALDGAERSAEHYAAMTGSKIRVSSGEAPMTQPKPLGSYLTDPVGAISQNLAAGRELRVLRSEGEQRRGASLAVIATGTTDPATGAWTRNRNFLTELHNLVAAGRNFAYQMARDADPRKRIIGRLYQKAVEEYQKTIDYADAHWNDPKLIETVNSIREELKKEIDFENANGMHVEERENYTPNLWEGSFWHDNGINFSPRRLLGTQFRQQRTFKNPYEAIAYGPYILATMDAADLVQHRVSQGRRSAMRNAWLDELKHTPDPDSTQPIARDPVPVLREEDVKDPTTGVTSKMMVRTGWKEPSKEYKLVRSSPDSTPVGIRLGYEKLIQTLLTPSTFKHAPMGEAALIGASMLKHGVILIADTFHFARLTEYAAALLGRKTGFRGGWSVLHYRPEDLPEAVAQRYIGQEAADWALAPVTIRQRGGSTTMTRHDLATQAISQGLNATKITDAMYKEAVRHIPLVGEPWWKLIGPYNRWLFDRYIPGLVIETAVRHIEEANAKRPDVHIHKLINDVVKDTNIFYGNLGRQGVFKSATWRDFNQVLFLAPMWVEGLIQKEVRFASRLSGLSYATGRQGVPYLGALGKGMTRGLAGFFILTQMINLVTRGKPTWMNEEKEHKLDAWVGGKKSGYWLSPMAIFAETIHDIVRLTESKPTNFDAVTQIIGNKLGPVGKMLAIAYTGMSPTGERYSTTAGRLKGSVGQLLPAPIAFGTPARALAHAVAPSLVSPPRKGALGRQLLASLAGLKVTPGQTPLQEIGRLADHWMKANKLDTGTLAFLPTDEASLSKLRAALRNDDVKGATRIFREFNKKRTREQIRASMETWARKPITGSIQNEQRFMSSLDNHGLAIHNRAMEQKMLELQMVNRFISSQR